jgi:asparagine synthase (glutamine-hydrolysing)
MCGIAGTVGAPPDRSLLEGMAATMVKRGPDGQGVWMDERAGLAATRLAVIDLHVRSNQPLHLGSLHLVFNGEIYNYRELRVELRQLGHAFETEGDAEVLLHAWAEWGAVALERLNGMFAFAIWDGAAERLWLASDPFGEKPLYYALRGDRIVFASEIKALLQDPSISANADAGALAGYLVLDASPTTDKSFFAGIERLPAAQLLAFSGGRAAVRRYWVPAVAETPARYEDAVETLRELLLDSIRLRLRSDVPVGTSLSGGIDSSTVVMLSSELAGDHTRHAFTAHFPGFERDEWGFASEVAQRAGVVQHHAIQPTVHEVIDDLPQLVLDHEEPVGSLSIYAQWCVMKKAKSAGVTVLLDGQGGDEFFGGYTATVGWLLRSSGLPTLVREAAADRACAWRVVESLAFDYLPTRLRRVHRRRIASPYTSDDLVAAAAQAPIQPHVPWFSDGSSLRRQLVTQSFETSLPPLLRYADRSSMAWSREVRLPYLDRRVAEFGLSLPATFLYRNGVSKRILRDVGRGHVPDSILARRDKVGFEPPSKAWLNDQGFRNLIGDILLDTRAKARGLYDTSAIEADLRHGPWRDIRGIWRALNTELWLRELVETRPSAELPKSQTIVA